MPPKITPEMMKSNWKSNWEIENLFSTIDINASYDLDTVSFLQYKHMRSLMHGTLLFKLIAIHNAEFKIKSI